MLQEPLLTTAEVAHLLKMTEATVRRWIRDGALPAIQIGREWRIAAADLDEFLAHRTTRPGANGGSAQARAKPGSTVGRPLK